MRCAALLGIVLGASGCALYVDDPGAAPDGDDDIVEPPPTDDPLLGSASPWHTDEPGIVGLTYGPLDVTWAIDDAGAGGVVRGRNIWNEPFTEQTIFSAAGPITSFTGGALTWVYDDGSGMGEVRRLLSFNDGSGQVEQGYVLDVGQDPRAVVFSDAFYYYALGEPGDVSIRRVPVNGGTPEVVASGLADVWDLSAREGVVFFTDAAGGRLVRVAGVGAAPEVVAEGFARTRAITHHFGTVLFVACADPACARSTLYELDGAAAAPALDPVADLPGNELGEIAVTAGGRIAWGRWMINRDRTTELLVTEDVAGSPFAVMSNGASFYIADHGSGVIFRRDY